jgi:hypothetical protein
MATSETIPAVPTSRAPHGRRAWRVAGSILAGLTILLGAASLWSCANELTAETETQQQTYQHAVSRVELDLDDGQISLTPGEAGQVVIERRLEWSAGKPTIEEKWAGDTLQITSRCGGSSLGTQPHCSVAYTMRVPADVTIDARTLASRIEVRDLRGSLRLSESSGDVKLTNTTGSIWVRTTSGGIAGAGLRAGQVEVQATSGDVDLRLAAAPEKLTATTKAGNVHIGLPGDDAYQVTVETSGGDKDVTVRQESPAARTIGVRTSRGDVRIRYAS